MFSYKILSFTAKSINIIQSDWPHFFKKSKIKLAVFSNEFTIS